MTTESLRLDYVATMPGAVRSARTYSLLLQDDALFVIDLGPAKGLDPKVGGLTKVLTNMLVSRMEKKMHATIDATIAEMDARGPEAMAARKGSFAFSPTDVIACEMGKNGYGSRSLKLKTQGRDFAFIPAPGGEGELEVFCDVVHAWANLD